MIEDIPFNKVLSFGFRFLQSQVNCRVLEFFQFFLPVEARDCYQGNQEIATGCSYRFHSLSRQQLSFRNFERLRESFLLRISGALAEKLHFEENTPLLHILK